MKVDDPDWLRCFGTDDSVIERPRAKGTSKKTTRAPTRRKQAELIEQRPVLFRELSQRPDRQPSLFN